MSIRFLADADLNYAIVSGTRHLNPSIDFVGAVEAKLAGMDDLEVLLFAASQSRIQVPTI